MVEGTKERGTALELQQGLGLSESEWDGMNVLSRMHFVLVRMFEKLLAHDFNESSVILRLAGQSVRIKGSRSPAFYRGFWERNESRRDQVRS